MQFANMDGLPVVPPTFIQISTMNTTSIRATLTSVAIATAFFCHGAHADIFVSSEKDNAIVQMDVDGNLIRSIPTCLRPRHMSWSNDKQTIMVACGDSDQLGVVNVKTGKVTDVIPTGESPEIFALSPDGKSAYVSIEDEAS
jgi:YVTN family beta-propeller protein